jgi:NAD(P)-dependent dehydrogenase (short-subunit alcohol dehydrogenase family)
MTKTLAGKVALVTGGSRGIGAATAKALADQGADVAISYVGAAELAEAVVGELKSRGVRAAAFKADQGDPAQAEKLIADVAGKLGRLDILVNNGRTLRRGNGRCNARHPRFRPSAGGQRHRRDREYPGGIAHHGRRRPHHLYVVRRRDPRRLAWFG